MSVSMVIEVRDKRAAEQVVQAIETYKMRLADGIGRTKRRLSEFERRCGRNTGYFLRQMTAEDLHGGDIEYVEWAGEARMLERLELELAELEDVRYRLP